MALKDRYSSHPLCTRGPHYTEVCPPLDKALEALDALQARIVELEEFLQQLIHSDKSLQVRAEKLDQPKTKATIQ